MEKIKLVDNKVCRVMLTVLFLVLFIGMGLEQKRRSTIASPASKNKTKLSASLEQFKIQHKFVLSQLFAHNSAFHADRTIKNRLCRSANNITNTDITNTISETSTTGNTQGYINYTSSNVITTTTTSFSLYVPGFYGVDCINRAFAYMKANPGVYTNFDAACACIGNCPPPLAPNPDAYNWYMNYISSSSKVIRQVTTNAPYIAATSIITIAGLGGNVMALVSLIKWLPRSETNLCMASQCVADLLLLSLSPGILAAECVNFAVFYSNIRIVT